jgi:16S rRNA (cytosine1402-N4)-methyltransferase
VTHEFGGHTPVLIGAVNELLGVRPGDVVVDATVGLGGHSSHFARAMGASGTLIGLDVDPAALEVARSNLSDLAGRIELHHANFSELPELLQSCRIHAVDVLFADLGVNSPQLDDPARGFSFQRDGPLDMRMDPRLTVTAADLINRLSERELGDLFYYNAQETGGRRIAKQICQARRTGRILTTARLAKVVCEALHLDPGSRVSRIHPATKAFLALRIAVNQEIENLQTLLEAAPGLLKPGGRFGLIAFHSVEDKPIKLDFRRRKIERVYDILTKKPIVADDDERKNNPRSRSAKLRVTLRCPSA